MTKHIIAVLLPLALLMAGCAANIDSTAGDDEDTAESAEAITSFFGSGDTSLPFCADGTPVAKSPSAISTRVLVDAAGSCIMQGATMKLLVPFSTTTYGPFAMSWDDSGTRLKANVGSSFPTGTCRIVQVTNPNGKASNLPSLCR